jgi:hypothetical protein
VTNGLENSGGYGGEATPVVIQLVLHQASGEPSPSVAEAVGRHRATISRQFPSVDDPTLRVYWQVTAPAAEATELQEELLELPEVDGAYVKPSEEPA